VKVGKKGRREGGREGLPIGLDHAIPQQRVVPVQDQHPLHPFLSPALPFLPPFLGGRTKIFICQFQGPVLENTEGREGGREGGRGTATTRKRGGRGRREVVLLPALPPSLPPSCGQILLEDALCDAGHPRRAFGKEEKEGGV